VNGGPFLMGDNETPAASPVRDVTVGSLYVAETEVQVRKFWRFIEDTGYRTSAEMEFAGWEYDFETGWTRKPGITWSEPGYRNDGEYPVTVVSWYDAAAFCNWLSGRDGLTPAYEITGTGPEPEVVWDTAANGTATGTCFIWGRRIGV